MNYYDRLLRKPALYLTPRDLLQAAIEYFEWVDSHPLLEEKVFQYQGDILRADASKMRPYTKTGLASFLGTTVGKLTGMRRRGEEWEEALNKIDQFIHTQKFDGAAAGLLNATIIARDLGLTEKTEVQGSTDKSAPPVKFEITTMISGTFLPPEDTPNPS